MREGIVQQSDSETASALIYTGACNFHGIIVCTDGTNDITLNIYDNIAGSGTKIIPETIIPTSADIRSQHIKFPTPVKCSTGLYVTVSGSGTESYMVYYETSYR